MKTNRADNNALGAKHISRIGTAGRIAALGGAFALCIVGAGVPHKVMAEQAQSTASANQHVEGDWVRTDLEGSGSFGGLNSNIEKAQLTPEGASMLANMGGRGPRGAAFTENRVHAVGDPYIVVDQPCGGGGGGFGGGALGLSPDSGAIHIIEQKDEVIVAPERGGSRRIYMDGRAHPAPSLWMPSPAGHSVGHYENGVLVVDTVGLTPGGVPGGGYRSSETHLTQRFEVSPDGKHLILKFTYTDPTIYVKPHSYQLTFDRLPEDSSAFEDWCDASDPIEKQSIVPPPQQ